MGSGFRVSLNHPHKTPEADERQPPPHAQVVRHSGHMPVTTAPCGPPHIRPPRKAEEADSKGKCLTFQQMLESEAATILSAALADGTKMKVNTALRNYAKFCGLLGYEPHANPGGMTDHELNLYIAWMARTLSHATIGGYLTCGVRYLSEAAGIRWIPPNGRYSTKLMMQGVARLKGTGAPNRKHAVTIDLLRSIHGMLNMTDHNDHTFWTVCVFLFFTFLRKGHVLQKTSTPGPPTPQTILRRDITVAHNRLVLTVRHTKTIQFGQRTIRWLLTDVGSHDPICPTGRLAEYMLRTKDHIKDDAPLFQELVRNRTTGSMELRPLRYDNFINRFKDLLARAGADPSCFSGHSFRRGGATFARDAGVPDNIIKAMGDWQSEAWQRYIAATDRLRERAAELLTIAVMRATTSSKCWNRRQLQF